VIVARASALVIVALVSQAAPQQPVFRSGADLVTVPVAIRSSGAPVGGLVPGDFVVTDNGVRQTVEVLDAQTVPADITLIVETSKAIGPYLQSMDGQMRKIAAIIRPTDRFEILGASTYVEEILPLREARLQPAIPPLKPHGLSSINDAMVAALLRQPDAGRPHLVIVLSDTIDTMSSATMETVTRVAKYTSSTLVIAWITMDLTPASPIDPNQSPFAKATSEREEAAKRGFASTPGPSLSIMGGTSIATSGGGGSYARTEPPTGEWHPHYLPRKGRRVADFDPLKDAAEATGGALYLPGVFVNRTASVIFEKLYNDYRSRYVLRYERVGAPGDGWHEIAITIPRLPKAEIAAKRGYFVDKK
jgi:VWFA-related protein